MLARGWRRVGVLAAFVLLVVAASFLSSRFLTVPNLLNVLRQVENVASNPFVQEAWERGADLTVHGWCYSIKNGLITDLGTAVGSLKEAEALRS